MNTVLRFQHILTPEGFERQKRLVIDDIGRIDSIEDEAGDAFDGWLALPGMPDAHSHCFQRAMVGLGESAAGEDSFWSWREAMYQLATRIGPEDLQVIATRAFSDMLRGGFTSVAEFHYLHHLPDGSAGTEMAQAVIEGARLAGIRLTLLPVLYQRGGFDAVPASRQRRFVHQRIDDFLDLLDRLSGVPLGIAPHSVRAVEPAAIADVESGAREILGDVFPRHIHVSEQLIEVEECLEFYGKTPIELLAEHVSLDHHWSLVHATHATEAETEEMNRAGVTAVLCPLTEAYLGDGLFHAAAFREAGGRIAIGSDSNVRIDAIEELRLLEYGQRLRLHRRACLADETGLGRPLWELACRGGEHALGQPVGRLEPGAFADLVVLRKDSVVLSALEDAQALDALITAGCARDLAAVYVGGRRVVDNGEHERGLATTDEYGVVMGRLRNSL